MNLDAKTLKESLEILGSYLEERNLPLHLVAIGGGGLLLLEMIDRSTKDIDIIAFQTSEGYVRADALPAELLKARQMIASEFRLEEDWINSAPRSMIQENLPNQGLPEGFQDRVIIQKFGALTLSLASRFDQICFKLHAAVDRSEPRGKHVLDLESLDPTPEELIRAAQWTRVQDPSEGFLSILIQALKALGVKDPEVALQ